MKNYIFGLLQFIGGMTIALQGLGTFLRAVLR